MAAALPKRIQNQLDDLLTQVEAEFGLRKGFYHGLLGEDDWTFGVTVLHGPAHIRLETPDDWAVTTIVKDGVDVTDRIPEADGQAILVETRAHMGRPATWGGPSKRRGPTCSSPTTSSRRTS